MGKRSNFKHKPRDFYPTPIKAVIPLIEHLDSSFMYWEPCAGDFALCNHIKELLPETLVISAIDICPQDNRVNQADALTSKMPAHSDYIITNPPWDRKIMHPLIERFSKQAPTWLLIDADWAHTQQSAEYMKYCQKIVSIGRVKWIPDSKMTGKDNCAWYLFDQKKLAKTQFIGR